LLNADTMVASERGIDEQHPQFVALSEQLRDSLRALVAGARETGKT
jgi:hypothetical protein